MPLPRCLLGAAPPEDHDLTVTQGAWPEDVTGVLVLCAPLADTVAGRHPVVGDDAYGGPGLGTVDAVVTLAGLVPSESEREMAEWDAWYVFGVDRVHNKIEVAPFTPDSAAS